MNALGIDSPLLPLNALRQELQRAFAARATRPEQWDLMLRKAGPRLLDEIHRSSRIMEHLASAAMLDTPPAPAGVDADGWRVGYQQAVTHLRSGAPQ